MGTADQNRIIDAIGKIMHNLLSFRTSHTTISAFLGGFITFSVPEFQRDYAWNREAVEIFLQDIDRCRRGRLESVPRPHFFGAVVTSPGDVPGSSRPHKIIIDGQQRLATIFLLVNTLRQLYQRIADDLQTIVSNPELVEFFKGRADNLISNFERTNDIEFKSRKSVRKLQLNKADDPYFARLLAGEAPKETRKSHSRLSEARKVIEEYCDNLLCRADNPDDSQLILDTLYTVFLRDLHIVHLSANSSWQANRIYRVLNSRGIPVSNCDLLRASTLESSWSKLDAGAKALMNSAWDDILSGDGMSPDAALQAAFFSRTGIHGPRDGLIGQIEGVVFPSLLDDRNTTESEAKDILGAVCQLRDDISELSEIANGRICQSDDIKFTPVFKSRFAALTVVLEQYYCFPLIHAATVLDPAIYVRVCDLVERFAFRYGVVVKAPVHVLMPVFAKHIENFRNSPRSFKIDYLRSDLSGLIVEFANDGLFRERLRSMEYGRDTKKPLRYALVMIEYMFQWYNNNPQGIPSCQDTSRVIDFKAITLEHIEAINARNIDPDLKPFVNSIGNLTVMSQAENDTAANNSFEQKRPVFASSSLAMNREIAEIETWNVENYRRRENDLLDRLLAIFSI